MLSSEVKSSGESQPSTKVPKDWGGGLRENWVSDIIAGFIIFLIALPLSVGISIASGAPPTAGIITAIIGGVFGALLGGSYLTINGPAAGLIVIVLGAVQDLGQGDGFTGYRRMLACAVVAGALQIGLGLMRLGVLGVGVPGSVIHGMLAAIGFIIMVKQFPVAIGASAHSKDMAGLLQEVPSLIKNINPEVALIAAVGFIIILSFKMIKGRWARFTPAPLIVAVVGIGMAKLFDFEHQHLVSSHFLNLEVGPKLLLNLPDHLMSAVVFPDFSVVLSLTSIRYIVTLALVASIESLLTANAVDRLDPWKRASNLDRELISKGLCNAVSASIGGLPMIAEIVRSSANVSNGARTRWSNFFHGAFILSFLVAFPWVLHEIPLAALAAILMSVGYALAHPAQFLHTAKVGRDHFAAFLTTFLVTVFSDLLVGVFCGILVEMLFNVMRGAGIKHLFQVAMAENRDKDRLTIQVQSPLTFTNFLSLRKRMEKLDHGFNVDLTQAQVVDHTSLDHLQRYQSGGKLVQLYFSENQQPVSRHPLAARRIVKKSQSSR